MFCDLQEMFHEYWRGLSIPGAPQGFRLTLILEHALDQDLYEEGEAFFSSRFASAPTHAELHADSMHAGVRAHSVNAVLQMTAEPYLLAEADLYNLLWQASKLPAINSHTCFFLQARYAVH